MVGRLMVEGYWGAFSSPTHLDCPERRSRLSKPGTSERDAVLDPSASGSDRACETPKRCMLETTGTGA